ncbi:ubiquinol-cytochrome c reductase, iron-sulfur subunit [Cryptococcus deuterogattii 99/473]|uniref:Cytochrome b-c1 complex subunit Rieske, mitochondrial n=1 Tax=Cryptococcus deuterogattii Ram5 TaxID=1296110 RepID=A0A0D0UZ12_9TREE|nr:ubiquinol-cytochrome c reductase, iron-sulfur subunit [Cryptococcus deuterogattii LA55]KIR34630.1 ubiquinol-cytochrome c reductase, iron-sulfur subunit [Cryptococcus deuterogattii MMRL2647]KIR39434.1 ubiquinol-cytochrome c reductase, iron-sulfur subunit [Cryptococcus deuterogattii Ram5]KIR73769.1 ubiquinol-cytochrome c reductase, iron-sulfur subunit [Cryptococcus deuterogattii CA1014]KIR93261.1 ubiquinol-cytochrome c reductase, iron-sulfur subunit [Cryptococcus deuterogattii CBS 10090]KIR99
MAAHIGRINLLPTTRTLASGAPLARGISLAVPAAGDAHSHGHDGHEGPRPDIPAAWAFKAGARGHIGRTNALPTTPSFQQRFLSTTRNVPAAASSSATDVPDFSPYRAKNPNTTRNVSYFMVGALGALGASSVKSTAVDMLSNMAASADVLALAKIEVEMGAIPEGKNLIVKWRGKPVFIRHRTPDEIEEANSVDVKSLRDPETDEQRTQRPEWQVLVMVGVCTHLGCVPIGEAGDYGGWFCPCHGSHYDISGRIRRGPAPLNLEIPEYTFNDDEEKIVVG